MMVFQAEKLNVKNIEFSTTTVIFQKVEGEGGEKYEIFFLTEKLIENKSYEIALIFYS